MDTNNEDAMNTLRRVLKDNDGVNISSNSINLVVARVTDPNENPNNSLLSNNSIAFGKDEIYDTFGTQPILDLYNHQRNVSTISTDSVKLNFYEQNYQLNENTDFMNQPQTKLTSDDFNELYNLNRKSNIFNGLISKDSLSTDSNDQFTISTPVKTSMKSDFTDTDNLNEMSINKFMNNSNRTDVIIENDNQENNDPNAYSVSDYFNQQKHPNQTNDASLEDSLNKSKDSQMMNLSNLSNVTNQLSLNDEDEISFNFQRDGFGRQSMSEKRYAQLDAKNTDTFKRAKQRKLQQQLDKQNEQTTNNLFKVQDNLRTNGLSSTNENNTHVKSVNNFDNSTEQRQSKRISNFPSACCCFNEPQTYSQISSSSCPLHSSSQQTSPKTDQTISSTNQDDFYTFGSIGLKSSNIPIEKSRFHFNQQPTPFTLAAHHAANQQTNNQLNKLNHLNRTNNKMNQNNFSTRPQQQQQPQLSSINHNNYLINHQQSNYGMSIGMNENSNLSPQFGQWLGMKKSSSLESLQTMMHEIKKETVNYNPNQPYNTMRRPTKASRNLNKNESFRTAIDKSYEEYMDNLTMETGT